MTIYYDLYSQFAKHLGLNWSDLLYQKMNSIVAADVIIDAKSGQIYKSKLMFSSCNEKIDKALLNAILKSTPFKINKKITLPEYMGEVITYRFQLDLKPNTYWSEWYQPPGYGR